MADGVPVSVGVPKEDAPQLDDYFESCGAGYFKSFTTDPALYRRYVALRIVLVVLSVAATVLSGVTFRTGYVKLTAGDNITYPIMTAYARPFRSDTAYLTVSGDDYGLDGLAPTALLSLFISMSFGIAFCVIRARAEKQRREDDVEREGLDVFSANTLAYYVQKEVYRRRVDRAIGIFFFCFCILSIVFELVVFSFIITMHDEYNINCQRVIFPCKNTFSAGFALTIVCVALEVCCAVLLVIPCVCGFTFKKPSYEKLLEKAHTDCPVELRPRRNLNIAVSANNPIGGNYGGGRELDVIVGRICADARARDDDGGGGGGYVNATPAAYFNAPPLGQRDPGDSAARAAAVGGASSRRDENVRADGPPYVARTQEQQQRQRSADDRAALKAPPFWADETARTVRKDVTKDMKVVKKGTKEAEHTCSADEQRDEDMHDNDSDVFEAEVQRRESKESP